MIILSVDTSSTFGSIAITKSNGDSFSSCWEKERSHSDVITVKLDQVLKEANINLKQITHLASGIGPGSFTGLRVGINLIKTLAYTLDKPCYGIDSLFALALNAPKEELPIFTFTNAFRNLGYIASYQIKDNTPYSITSPAAWTVEEISQKIKSSHVCIGNGYEVFKEILPDNLKKLLVLKRDIFNYPDASTIAQFLLQNSNFIGHKSWKTLKPLYIRGSEAEEKLGRGLLKPLPKL